MAIRVPIDRAVSVTVTRADRFPTTSGFNTAFLLVKDAVAGKLDATKRTRLYSNMDDVALDWAFTTEPYKAANRFFSARVRPPQMKMGYRNPANPIGVELDLIWAADPDWYWGLHTVELNDTPDQRAIADWAETHKVLFGLDSNDPDTELSADVNDATSTVTITIASPGVVSWAAHGLVAGDAVRFATTGSLPTGLVAGTTYYVVSPTTNAFSVAATPGGSAIATTGTQSGTHTATAPKFGGSIAEYVEDRNYDRSPVFYHTDPASYLAAGAWGYTAGRNFDRSNYREAIRGRIDSGQAYTLKLKTLPGVVAVNKPSAVIQAISGFVPGLGIDPAQGHRANTYISLGGIDMLVEGTVGSGAFIDEIHAADWLIARTQESVLGVLANNARVPYDNRGTGFLIEAGVNPPLRRAFAAGLIAARDGDDGEYIPAFEVSVDDVANIPTAQRRNRIAPDIKARFTYAGAIHFVSVSMTMQF